jgi:hypothetical protein
MGQKPIKADIHGKFRPIGALWKEGLLCGAAEIVRMDLNIIFTY